MSVLVILVVLLGVVGLFGPVIAGVISRKAAHNKTGRAVGFGGLIVAKVARKAKK